MSPPSPLLDADPRELGRYVLIGRIGRGGQGIVYLGASPEGVGVAVKLMHSRLDDERARRRFIVEVEAVRRVAPFCTAQVLDADLDGDRPYIVSEYVEGVSLQELVTTEGPRTGGALDRIAVATATAMAAIHGAGVVHRDFKPGNVLMGLDGPRVIDFGISRMMDTTATTGRVPVGTPAYLSPEQLKGERAGPPADVFAWALTVAFTAGGRHAYAADSFEAILGRILFGRPDLDPLAGPLRELVADCLAEDPARRPTAEEVLRRLIARDAVRVASSGEALKAGAGLASEGAGEGEGPATLTLPPRSSRAPGDDDRPTLTALSPHQEDEDDDQAHTPVVPLTAVPARDDARHGGPGTPASPPPVGRRRLWWPVVIMAGAALVTGVAAVVVAWRHSGATPDGAQAYAGRWTGSAEHPTAGRVFPVEVRLGDAAPRSSGSAGSAGSTEAAGTREAAGRMRWGADLHCAGRLVHTRQDGATATYRLDQVRGNDCYPGTVTLRPSAADRATFRVTREGETTPRYSGTVTRTP
ncbi:serine/threonine protein kinase [Sphaerisporangium album]|uniref:Serine/threonine protein kinase n=1 Tax=Sphaerisporangium album TaxID=509200 RepID=A0A367FPJ6_9ACTN|nr:serine/threonine-protein kinase [Sphaerisporangium album]RCG32323.1 serine/threonine protein kinase [Sphaerisporangium album]